MDVPLALSPKLSYQLYDTYCVALLHGTGLVLRLNRAAGEWFRALDKGEKTAEQLDPGFSNSLQKLGILVGSGKREPAQFETTTNPLSAGQAQVLELLTTDACRQRIPIHAQVELTYRCPLRCEHCYLQSEKPNKGRELTTRQMCDFLDQWAELGGLFLLLTGGEVFLRKDFKDIFNHARRLRLAVSLLTTGYGQSVSDWLYLIERGLDQVQISLYGPDASIHDAFTGVVGSFDYAWNALLLLKRHGVQVRAAIGVNRGNFAFVQALTNRLEGEGIRFNFNTDMLPLRDGQRVFRVMPLEKTEFEELVRMYPDHWAHGHMKGKTLDDPPCNAARAMLALDPYGRLSPCLMWREFAGSIVDQEDCESSDNGAVDSLNIVVYNSCNILKSNDNNEDMNVNNPVNNPVDNLVDKSVDNFVDNSLAQLWHTSEVFLSAAKLSMTDLEDCASCEQRELCRRCTGLDMQRGFSKKEHSLVDCWQTNVIYSIQTMKEEK